MNWADWLILGVLALSSLIGIWRGFVREALSLLCWLVALVVAMHFHRSLATLLTDHIATPSVRHMVAFGGLFVFSLIVGALISYLIAELVRVTGLSGTDRLLGMLFGLGRGVVLVLLLVLFLPKLVPVNQDLWWQQSRVIPHFVAMEGWATKVWGEISSRTLALF